MTTRRAFLQSAAAFRAAHPPAQVVPDRSAGPPQGSFRRRWWYLPGIEHGNPVTNRRFRVNSPEVVLHPSFGSRPEVRSSGMLQILMEEDLSLLSGAELLLELWGGHPGTANKRVTPNGRTTYALPENGTAAKHCTHLYPTVRLKVTDLVRGHNALQFACDQGDSFWGHFIVEQACLGAALKPDHPDLAKLGLAAFRAAVAAAPAAGEKVNVSLRVEAGQPDRIESVLYQGFYTGYDENGNGEAPDWHGFTKSREPVAWLGSVSKPPFEASWDLSMLPAQRDVAVRAIVRFKDHMNLEYLTPAAGGLSTPARPGRAVRLLPAEDMPAPFWSRAGNLRTAVMNLPLEPREIERCELHIVVWDGGRGAVKEPFKLNGTPLEVAGEGRHDVIYSRVAIQPSMLKRGENRMELLSDTTHHGIEVLLPGPALVVRYRT